MRFVFLYYWAYQKLVYQIIKQYPSILSLWSTDASRNDSFQPLNDNNLSDSGEGEGCRLSLYAIYMSW